VFDTSRDGKPPFEAAALLALLLSEVLKILWLARERTGPLYKTAKQ
jgi:predicted GNAT superfamily acetyltransferase